MDYSELAIRLKALQEQEKLIREEKSKIKKLMTSLRKRRIPSRREYIRQQLLSLLCIQSKPVGLYEFWLIASRVINKGITNERYLKEHLEFLASEHLVAYKSGRGKNGALIRTYCITQKGILEVHKGAPKE